ncbi:rCG63467 [Rattus norvegicus]|uniref:RCG63467 n=1 Tax=Rattus norvegicus TaxID=10116 RepID=A6HAQ4_RAT|nr:rCG63467 [Rattus norvegicus]
MWGEFIGLKSALFGFAPPLFPGSPTWGANMAWKRGMSSAPHLALLLRSELESPRGRGKKGIPHFHPDWDSPFLQLLQAAVILLGLSVIVVLSAPASSNGASWELFHRKGVGGGSSIMAGVAPFFSLSLSLSLTLFLSFPREPGYLIFLSCSRCHLPLMVGTKEILPQ